ncbi:MAG: hypothetical protein FJ144_15525 [Deltaproteobacteria bacterium]|nr:hypothetical protein [Deltaproteobacteria bacterium]
MGSRLGAAVELPCIPPMFPETADRNCTGPLNPDGGFGVLVRGGDFSYHEWAGVFAMESIGNPSFGLNDSIRGFRCAH